MSTNCSSIDVDPSHCQFPLGQDNVKILTMVT